MGITVRFKVCDRRNNPYVDRTKEIDVACLESSDNSTDFVHDLSTVDGRWPRPLKRVVNGGDTPEWFDFVPFQFVKKTIEGQQMLERVVSRYGIRYPLDLPKPKYWADGSHVTELADNESWRALEIPNIDPQQVFLDYVDESADAYIYTIRLIDHDTDEELYYVGRSTQVVSRLQQHLSSGGDFSAARRRDTHVHEIVSIEPEHEICEREKYSKVNSSVESPVHGGR